MIFKNINGLELRNNGLSLKHSKLDRINIPLHSLIIIIIIIIII